MNLEKCPPQLTYFMDFKLGLRKGGIFLVSPKTLDF